MDESDVNERETSIEIIGGEKYNARVKGNTLHYIVKEYYQHPHYFDLFKRSTFMIFMYHPDSAGGGGGVNQAKYPKRKQVLLDENVRKVIFRDVSPQGARDLEDRILNARAH